MEERLIKFDEFDEVVESEMLTSECLRELRQWAREHPFIKGINLDKDGICLQFLRARKFCIPKTKELFERCMIFLKQHPEMFDYSEENFATVMELYDTGYITVLSNQDEKRRRVVLCRTGMIDTKKFNIDDVMRLFSLISLVLLQEEATQKHGTVFINDLSGVNASHLQLLPYKILSNFSSYLNVSAVRTKAFFVVGLPSFAVHVFKAIRLVLNEKLRSRLHVMSSVEDLWPHVDRSIMPSEYGSDGESVCDMLAAFRKSILGRKDELKMEYDALEVDFEGLKGVNKK